MAAFEAEREALAADGVRVIAASADSAENAAGTVTDLALGFPVGFGLPLVETAAELGAMGVNLVLRLAWAGVGSR